MNVSKTVLGMVTMMSIASSCFALESGIYNRIEGEKVYTFTVIAHDGFLFNKNTKTRLEFVSLKNNVQECYSSVLLRTGDKSYATTSGLVTDDSDEKTRIVNGYLSGKRIGYDRMLIREGDFTIEELGDGKIKVSSNVGYVKGFCFDGEYRKDDIDFVVATPSMALHALEVIAKTTGFLGNVDLKYRVLEKDNRTGYSILTVEREIPMMLFDVDGALNQIKFENGASHTPLFISENEVKG